MSSSPIAGVLFICKTISTKEIKYFDHHSLLYNRISILKLWSGSATWTKPNCSDLYHNPQCKKPHIPAADSRLPSIDLLIRWVCGVPGAVLKIRERALQMVLSCGCVNTYDSMALVLFGYVSPSQCSPTRRTAMSIKLCFGETRKSASFFFRFFFFFWVLLGCQEAPFCLWITFAWE